MTLGYYWPELHPKVYIDSFNDHTSENCFNISSKKLIKLNINECNMLSKEDLNVHQLACIC